MDRTIDFLRVNPSLLVPISVGAVAVLVCGALAIGMHRAGLSLRPLLFFLGFLGLIGGPQLAAHLAIATGHMSRAGLTRVPDADRPAPVPVVDRDALAFEAPNRAPPRFREPERLFGPDVADATLRDGRDAFGDALTAAEVAQLAFYPGLETAIVARFADDRAAHTAWARSLALLGASAPAPAEPGAPVTVRRPAGDLARVTASGRALLLWTAPDEATLERRMRSAGAIRLVSSDEAADRRAVHAGRTPWQPAGRVLAGFLVLNLVAAAAWFFKGTAWAAQVAAAPGATTLSAPELLARLRAAAPADAPWHVAPGRTPDELEVTWRYADARWLDLAGANRLSRVHRLVLRLDEDARSVRVSEYWARFDARIGRAGVHVGWRRARGITFFEHRQERVFGVQLDALGRPTGRASYAYRFDLQELKAPFIAATTAAGWSWRPLVWDAPVWLRWATE